MKLLYKDLVINLAWIKNYFLLYQNFKSHNLINKNNFLEFIQLNKLMHKKSEE